MQLGFNFSLSESTVQETKQFSTYEKARSELTKLADVAAKQRRMPLMFTSHAVSFMGTDHEVTDRFCFSSASLPVNL